MTKKKKIIIGLCVLMAILLALIGGHVLAKYQSRVTGNGVADIAQWAFEVNGGTSEMQRFSICQNYDPATLTNGRMAPGTEGYFDLILNTIDSEVAIDYSVDFSNEQNKPANLKFRYEGEEYDTLDELETHLTGTIAANGDVLEKIKYLHVEWFWDYDSGDDVADTNSGTSFADYTFDVEVTGTQSVPQHNS